MKKLLASLATLAIASSAAAPVVSCAYNTNIKSNVNKEANFYADVSAQALKAGVLNDQPLNILGSDTSIDYKYASSYFGSQKIVDVFGNYFGKNQGANVDSTSKVSSLYDTTFGTAQGGYNYTIANSFSSLKKSSGVKEWKNSADTSHTNLWKLINGSSTNSTQPDSQISDTLVAATNAAKLVFGNDFSPLVASTLIGLLSSSTISKALTEDSVAKIFKDIDMALTNYGDGIDAITKSLTQSDIAKKDLDDSSEPITMREQLSNSTQDLFKGLIFFISNKTLIYKYDDPGSDSKAVQTFWDYLLNGETAAIADGTVTKNTDTSGDLNITVKAIAPMISFGMTLIHYFRAFDRVSKISFVKMDGANKIYSNSETNGVVEKQILDEPYVANDDNDDFWYFDGTSRTFKLNLQNFFSDLAYYFYPVDGKGYQTLRAFNILLGGEDNGTNHLSLNPILKTALNPLIGDGEYLENLLDNNLGFLDTIGSLIGKTNFAKTVVKELVNLIQNYSSSLITWLVTDGDNETARAEIEPILSTLGALIGIIPSNVIQKLGLPDKYKKIISIVISVGQLISSPAGKSFIAHPWSTIYGGNLLNAISKMSIFADSDDNTLRKFAYGLGKLGDLRSILVMNIEDLTTDIGYMINKPLNIPDYLYSLRKKSIGWVVNYLAGLDKTNAYNTLTAKTNNSYSINTGALAQTAEALTANSTDDKSKIKLTATTKDGKEVPVSPIMPLYESIINYGKNVKLDIPDIKVGPDQSEFGGTFKYYFSTDGKSWDKTKTIFSVSPFTPDNSATTTNVDPDAFYDILGVSEPRQDGEPTFTAGTILYGISRLYGHNYIDAKGNHVDYSDMTNGAESLFTMFNAVSDFTKESINQLVIENYDKYFDPKNWKVKNIWQKGLDSKDTDGGDTQHLGYDLMFLNPDTKRWVTYKVEMSRQGWEPGSPDRDQDTGWVVEELMLQD